MFTALAVSTAQASTGQTHYHHRSPHPSCFCSRYGSNTLPVGLEVEKGEWRPSSYQRLLTFEPAEYTTGIRMLRSSCQRLGPARVTAHPRAPQMLCLPPRQLLRCLPRTSWNWLQSVLLSCSPYCLIPTVEGSTCVQHIGTSTSQEWSALLQGSGVAEDVGHPPGSAVEPRGVSPALHHAASQ